MKLETLTVEHCLGLTDIEEVHGFEAIGPRLAVQLEMSGGGWAAIDGGRVLAIGGVAPRWEGTAYAWATLSRAWRKRAGVITEICRRHLEECEFHRVEVGVRADYQRGHSWARRLGLTVETPLARKWGPDGSDYTIYVKVK